MYLARHFRSIARKSLRGFWALTIGVTLVAVLLGDGFDFVSSSSTGSRVTYRYQDTDCYVTTMRSDPAWTLSFTLHDFFTTPLVSRTLAVLLPVAAVLAVIQLLIGGAIELGLTSLVPHDALAERLLQAGVSRAVVTLGSEGALALEEGHTCLIPAVPVQARDTTGAGDCFHAALTVRLAEGASLLEAAQFAARTAALSVSKPHVLTALPFRETVERQSV